MNPTLEALLHFIATWWVELLWGVVIVAVVPLVADVVAVIGTLDIVLGEVDR